MTSPYDTGLQMTDEERVFLGAAQRDGYVSAKLFAEGDFSEEGFVLFGKLEIMCLKGLLKFVGKAGRERPGARGREDGVRAGDERPAGLSHV